MKKRYVCYFIGALLLLAALIWVSGWASARFAPPAPGLPEHAELAEHGAVQPGDVLTATALVVVPADTIPERPEVSGDGIVSLNGETELLNWRWNTCAYRVTARFRTLKNGETTDARLQFRLRPFPADRAAREIALPLPKFSAKLDAKLAPDAELLLADEILAAERTPRSPWRYLWLLIPLAVYSFYTDGFLHILMGTVWFIPVLSIVFSFLLVCEFPMFSLKKMTGLLKAFIIGSVVLVVACLIREIKGPWYVTVSLSIFLILVYYLVLNIAGLKRK